MGRNADSFRRTNWWIIFAGILVVLGFVAAGYGYSAFIGRTHFWEVPRADLAALGNFLQGTVAPLWSLAAFIFIYVAFLLQQEELEHNRKQALIQETIAVQQRFENSFFNLLNLHRQLLDRIKAITPQNERVEGTEAFSILYNELMRQFARFIPDPQLDELTKIERAYLAFYTTAQSEVGHYFRDLYHIIRFIDASRVEADEKPNYAKLVRAQLSSVELLLLFYNGLSTFGRRKFKPLIEKYALLEQVPKSQLLNPTHEHLYYQSAFHE